MTSREKKLIPGHQDLQDLSQIKSWSCFNKQNINFESPGAQNHLTISYSTLKIVISMLKQYKKQADHDRSWSCWSWSCWSWSCWSWCSGMRFFLLLVALMVVPLKGVFYTLLMWLNKYWVRLQIFGDIFIFLIPRTVTLFFLASSGCYFGKTQHVIWSYGKGGCSFKEGEIQCGFFQLWIFFHVCLTMSITVLGW